MKTIRLFWSYLTQFYLAWEIVSDQSCRGNQNTYLMFNNFFSKMCHLWNNAEKYCRARQATDGNIIHCLHIVSWILKTTNTHSQYVILIVLFYFFFLFFYFYFFIFFTAIVVAQICLSVTIQYISCLVYNFVSLRLHNMELPVVN